MKFKFVLFLALGLLLMVGVADAQTDLAGRHIAKVTFTAVHFNPTHGQHITPTTDGLTLTDAAHSGVYIAPPVKAPIDFNAIVPEWRADVPAGADIHVFVRTGPDGQTWGSWYDIHANPDWMTEDDPTSVGDMLIVPSADGTHRYAQYRLEFDREDTAVQPLLRQFSLVFIDSTDGPTSAELVARQQDLDPAQGQPTSPENGYPRPPVISRDVWCTDPACDYDPGTLSYQPVTHLVLHHTVTGTGDGDAAPIVRAIWRYHTFSLDWGDIGYHYLVDINGVIYEGHLGGDDVVGIHASIANVGSMGVSLIGDFGESVPPPAMVESATKLFAWKADQRSINVLDASRTLPNVEWGLPNLMAHRDVLGTTACPGDRAHELLPGIRQEVARRIGLEDPYLYVDELSPNFIKSNANWYVPIYMCGHNVHAFYTWSTTDPSKAVNWGEWRPEVPENGRYRIEVYVPRCNTFRPDETSGATYTITHAGGVDTVILDHDRDVGLWLPLGEYNLRAGTGNVIHLTDLTTTDDGMGVWFDALRLLPLEPQPTPVNALPQPNTWLTTRTVLFNWTMTEPEAVISTTLQVATDPGLANLIVDETWDGAVYNASHIFSADYAELYWRVLLTSENGSLFPSPPTRFGIDSQPPTSQVTRILAPGGTTQYHIQWQGNDNLSGVRSYTIDYRAAGEEGWAPWLTDVAATIALFSPPDPGETYEFRSRATDELGNQEAPHAAPDATTSAAIVLEHAIMLPTVMRR